MAELYSAMQEHRERLNELERQATVHSLAELFKAHPNLESFSFQTLARGLPGQRAGVRVNGEILHHIERSWERGDSRHQALIRLSASVAEWVDARERAPLGLVRSWERLVIERPQPPRALLDGLMAQCLLPSLYSRWQAAALERSAGGVAPDSARPKGL